MERGRGNKFTRQIDALLLAAPVAALVRWKDWDRYKARCVEMSYSGAAALRRKGINAQPVGCSLVAMHCGSDGAADALCAIGHTVETAYSFAVERMFEKRSLEEFRRTEVSQIDAGSMHVVIEASDGKGHAFIDLTLGQVELVTRGAIRVPPQFAFHYPTWPELSFDEQGIRLFYGPTLNSHPPYEQTALGEDISEIMRLALKVDNDRTRFMSEVTAQQRRGAFASS